MTETPWFEIYLSICDCRYELRCNGVPICFDDQGLPLQGSFPVNHWLVDGDNMLELLLPDAPGELPESASVLVELRLSTAGIAVSRLSWRRDFLERGEPLLGSSSAGVYQLDEGVLVEIPDGDYRIGAVHSQPWRNGLRLSQTVHFRAGFPVWGYVRAPALGISAMSSPEQDAIHGQLYARISLIHQLLRQGHAEAVADLCNERNSELDQAFHRPAGTTRQRLLAVLADAIGDQTQVLAPVSQDILAMDPWSNNTLVRLVRSDFSPAIAWEWREPAMSRSVDFVFRRSGDDWVICR